MIKYLDFIKEHKFWGKTIPEFLNWLKYKSEKHFVLVDVESTGLPGEGYEIQLTQVSCIVIKYNFDSNTFEEIDTYNKKIKLWGFIIGIESFCINDDLINLLYI